MDTCFDRPFHVSEALAAGLTRRRLESKRFRRLFRGVYVPVGVTMSFRAWLVAALLVAPKDAVISHLSAARWWGLDLGGDRKIHVSTRTTTVTDLRGIRLHRRQAPIATRMVSGLPVTSPERTFVDCAGPRHRLSFIWLVALADSLVHEGHTSLADLTAYCWSRHLHGVRRARHALTLAREGAESAMETLVRLMLVFARLPEPECNVTLFRDDGKWLGRVDLVYRAHKVAVEYDGRWHERSAEQRTTDRDKRERLEADGWLVIVVYDTDVRHPRAVVSRVHEALCRRGYAGPRPVFSDVWTRWFVSRSQQF